MTIVSRVVVAEAQIAAGVQRAAEALAPEMLRIRFSLGEDWTGDPSVFFRVVLSNDASRFEHLGKIADRIEARITKKVKPGDVGLNSYFSFRSEAEQADLRDAAWA